MTRHSLVAAGVVILIAALSAIALLSVDDNRVEKSAVAREELPELTPEEAASVLPAPKVISNPSARPVFTGEKTPPAEIIPDLLLTDPPMYKTDGKYVVPKGIPGVHN